MDRFASALLMVFATTSLAPGALAADLTIWWNKGFYPEEDEAFERVVTDFERATGTDIDLTLLAIETGPPKMLAALAAHQPPDVAFGIWLGHIFVPRWAYDGLLADVSDVIRPVEDRFDGSVLEWVYLLNGETGARSYYGVPIFQATWHIHVWRSLLERAGLRMEDIPRDWDAFWDFWCDTVQPAVREATGNRAVYGVGQPMSTAADDTGNHFLMFAYAFGAEFMGRDGRLRVDEPEVRDGIIRALASYTEPFGKGCTPPGSVNWGDADNNVNFLNKITVMTPNGTLSIPAAQRGKSPEDYFTNIVTIPWPDRPGGGEITHLTNVFSAVIFDESEHIDRAKEFLRFLLEPERVGAYTEASLGRWYPVMPALAESAFWRDPTDPHRQILRRQLGEHPTKPLPGVYNYRYSQVSADRVWQRAIGRIVVEGWSAERAADEAIARIKEILGQ
jgi:multiple sugar transport system substrate-binding protein